MNTTWRRLPVIAALLALLAGALGCASSSGSPATGGGAAATPRPDKVMGAFSPIAGTDLQIAPITSDGSTAFSLSDILESARYFSYGTGYTIYNYVFFDTRSETVRALLPDNSARITRIAGYPEPQYPLPEGETPAPVRWWMYVLVKQDTNEDEELTEDDRLTIAVSDVGGSGYTELVDDVDGVLTTVFKDVDTLLVIYHAGGKYFLARIDLPTRAVTQTTELPSFGGDVK